MLVRMSRWSSRIGARLGLDLKTLLGAEVDAGRGLSTAEYPARTKPIVGLLSGIAAAQLQLAGRSTVDASRVGGDSAWRRAIHSRW